jgi:hypothetical protein
MARQALQQGWTSNGGHEGRARNSEERVDEIGVEWFDKNEGVVEERVLYNTHHLPALIYGLFCGNTKYILPRKNPMGST